METGDPNDGTNPFDPNEGADETTPLVPHRDEEEGMEMSTRTSTSTSDRKGHHTAETSFIDGTPSGIMRLEELRNEADERIKDSFPNADTSKLFASIDEYGRVSVKLQRLGGAPHPILDKDGIVIIDDSKGKFPKTLRKLLGKSAIEISTEKIAENTNENERARARIRDLDKQIPNSIGEVRERQVEERDRLQEGINERNQENEAIEERLPLRQRIKEIFKKYGFTVIAVSAAVATVIGVIVSSLKSGLAKVAQGVGNGLKELGAKLGQILPGMIGAIASFIFRTAGEVIGFLAKNAWLLIVGLVVFAVEQLKNKNK